jgi:hypothetical protein
VQEGDNDVQEGDVLGAAAEQSSRYVTAREYYCFKLQIRRGIFNILLFGGRLFQQWAVDMYIKIESMRLDWYSNPDNQKLIRAELYQVTNHVLLFINTFITLATFELHKAKIKCQNLLL